MRPLHVPVAFAAVAPAVLAFSMVSQLPPSALHVPKVQVASASEGGKGIALTPQALGAERTADGLRVRKETLNRTVAELARAFAAPPKPGAYEMTPQGVVLNHGTPGASLDLAETRELLVRALRSPGKELTLPLVEVPAPPPPQFAVIVRLSEFRIDLYEGTSLRKRFPVGVGALRFPTPPGVYHVKSKAKNPAWNNPGSPWARGMPRHIAPGPRNPLGTRALRLDRGALVIHGTPYPGSVGRRSSHGCMRLLKADVEELFEIVPTETPVFIIP